jgi:hypothetical protein
MLVESLLPNAEVPRTLTASFGVSGAAWPGLGMTARFHLTGCAERRSGTPARMPAPRGGRRSRLRYSRSTRMGEVRVQAAPSGPGSQRVPPR